MTLRQGKALSCRARLQSDVLRGRPISHLTHPSVSNAAYSCMYISKISNIFCDGEKWSLTPCMEKRERVPPGANPGRCKTRTRCPFYYSRAAVGSSATPAANGGRPSWSSALSEYRPGRNFLACS